MFYTVFSLIFVALAVLYALNGMRKGKKYIWSYSVAQIVIVLVSAIASAFLSSAISLAIFNAIFGAIASGNGELGALLTQLPVMGEALCAIASMIAAPILFYVIFAILRMVLGIVAKIVLRLIAKKIAQKKGILSEDGTLPAEENEEPMETGKKSKKKKKSKNDGYFRISGQKNPKGMLLGALCGLILFLATMIPVVGILGIVNDMTSLGIAGAESPMVQTIGSVVDAGANNIGAKAVRTVGGEALYSAMTTYKVGDEKATLAKETRFLGVMGRAMFDMTNPEVDRAEAANSFRQIDEAFQETTLIPTVLPEFLNAAKASWDRGESYCGIAKPSFDKMDGLIQPVLDVLGTSTKETIDEDVATLVDLTAYMIENDVMTDVKDDPISIFKKQEVTAEVMRQLLENDHMAPMVGGVSEFGLELFGEALGSPMTEIELDTANVADPQREAVALAVALAEMADVTEDLNRGGFNQLESIATMGPMLDAFAATETIGKENTDLILEGILSSPKIQEITEPVSLSAVANEYDIYGKADSMGYQGALEGLVAKVKNALPDDYLNYIK